MKKYKDITFFSPVKFKPFKQTFNKSNDSLSSLRWLFCLDVFSLKRSDSNFYTFAESNLNSQRRVWLEIYGKRFFFFRESSPVVFASNFSKIGLFERIYKTRNRLVKSKLHGNLTFDMISQDNTTSYLRRFASNSEITSKHLFKNKFNKNDVYLPNYVSLLNNYSLYKESIFRGFFSEGVYFADKPKYSMSILNFFSKTYYSDSLSDALNNYKAFVFWESLDFSTFISNDSLANSVNYISLYYFNNLTKVYTNTWFSIRRKFIIDNGIIAFSKKPYKYAKINTISVNTELLARVSLVTIRFNKLSFGFTLKSNLCFESFFGSDLAFYLRVKVKFFFYKYLINYLKINNSNKVFFNNTLLIFDYISDYSRSVRLFLMKKFTRIRFLLPSGIFEFFLKKKINFNIFFFKNILNRMTVHHRDPYCILTEPGSLYSQIKKNFPLFTAFSNDLPANIRFVLCLALWKLKFLPRDHIFEEIAFLVGKMLYKLPRNSAFLQATIKLFNKSYIGIHTFYRNNNSLNTYYIKTKFEPTRPNLLIGSKLSKDICISEEKDPYYLSPILSIFREPSRYLYKTSLEEWSEYYKGVAKKPYVSFHQQYNLKFILGFKTSTISFTEHVELNAEFLKPNVIVKLFKFKRKLKSKYFLILETEKCVYLMFGKTIGLNLRKLNSRCLEKIMSRSILLTNLDFFIKNTNFNKGYCYSNLSKRVSTSILYNKEKSLSNFYKQLLYSQLDCSYVYLFPNYKVKSNVLDTFSKCNVVNFDIFTGIKTFSYLNYLAFIANFIRFNKSDSLVRDLRVDLDRPLVESWNKAFFLFKILKNNKKTFPFEHEPTAYLSLVDKIYETNLVSNEHRRIGLTFSYQVVLIPLLNKLDFISSLKIIKSDGRYNYNLLKLIDNRNYVNSLRLVGPDFAYLKYQLSTFISIFFSKVAPTTLLKSLIDFEYYIKKILYTKRIDFFKVLPTEYARIGTLFRWLGISILFQFELTKPNRDKTVLNKFAWYSIRGRRFSKKRKLPVLTDYNYLNSKTGHFSLSVKASLILFFTSFLHSVNARVLVGNAFNFKNLNLNRNSNITDLNLILSTLIHSRFLSKVDWLYLKLLIKYFLNTPNSHLNKRYNTGTLRRNSSFFRSETLLDSDFLFTFNLDNNLNSNYLGGVLGCTKSKIFNRKVLSYVNYPAHYFDLMHSTDLNLIFSKPFLSHFDTLTYYSNSKTLNSNELVLHSKSNFYSFLQAGLTPSHFNFFFFYSKPEFTHTKKFFSQLLLPDKLFDEKKKDLELFDDLFFDKISEEFFSKNFTDELFGKSTLVENLFLSTPQYENFMYFGEHDLSDSVFFNFFHFDYNSLLNVNEIESLSDLNSFSWEAFNLVEPSPMFLFHTLEKTTIRVGHIISLSNLMFDLAVLSYVEQDNLVIINGLYYLKRPENALDILPLYKNQKSFIIKA